MKRIEERRDECGFARIFEYVTIEGHEYKTKCGLVDCNNKEIVPCKYHNILGFYNGAPLCCVELQNEWGYINKQGNEVVSCKYSFADDRFYCGLAMVERSGKYGFIDSTGRETIPCIYDRATIFWDNLCGVMKSGYYGCIDKQGHTVIPFNYDYLNVMGQKRIFVRKYGKCGMLDYNGYSVVQCEYDELSNILSDGRIEYKKGAEHGFMDLDGKNKQILPF